MLNLDWNIIYTIINLLVFFALLRIFLFKPITKMMESRTKEIQDGLESAEEKNAQAQAKFEEYDKRLETAHVQAAAIVSDAQARAQKEYDSILERAKEDAEKTKRLGRRQLELEREQMLRESKDSITDVVLLTTAKLSQKQSDEASQRQLIQSFLAEVEAKV